ncbi:MGMT family protein [Nesterenkonia haasae]|uniref:MGMT family protein n=1 Tax=Nesterenkonia haasae TaxID=2587813 RepID=UPI0013912BD8|nr:MGMT family protein [Nesterenkonia haasae]NDK31523.1 DNA methyltransferase [Nesterenkonia haasae]
MDEQTHERVRDVIASVPSGRVATYGDVAAIAGLSTPRLVGRVLREDGFDLPWHRIIRANGVPAPHLLTEQLERLRTEGVLAENCRIDLKRYRWNPHLDEITVVRRADAPRSAWRSRRPHRR